MGRAPLVFEKSVMSPMVTRTMIRIAVLAFRAVAAAALLVSAGVLAAGLIVVDGAEGIHHAIGWSCERSNWRCVPLRVADG